MSKKKPQLVPDNTSAQVSNLSVEEEARALYLADIALHNRRAPDPSDVAGTRAKQDHRRLIEEVQREADKIGEQAA
jgi:hypothetical protein